MTIREQLLDLWERTREANTLDFGAEYAPKPNPPASPEEIKQLEHHLGFPLPPSYRAFLVIANGVRHFCGNLHLLSASEIVSQRGHWEDDHKTFSLKDYIADLEEAEEDNYPDEPSIRRFIIGAADRGAISSLCLAPSTIQANGEMNVVEVDMETIRYPKASFLDFMKGALSGREKSLHRKGIR